METADKAKKILEYYLKLTNILLQEGYLLKRWQQVINVMLEKDPTARELLKQCLVRMPNQNLSETEARNVLEFMYANDGQEVGS